MKRVAGSSVKNNGFTLLELLIVLAILIVIIGILGTTIWGSYKRALMRAATIQITDTLESAVAQFKMEFGRYPEQREGLYILADMDNPDPNAGVTQNMGVNQTGGMGMNPGGMNNNMGGGMNNNMGGGMGF